LFYESGGEIRINDSNWFLVITKKPEAKENHLRTLRNAGLVFAVICVSAAFARAGQPGNVTPLPAGARFCPAPGADNAEFMSSYFSVDARTGRMTRHDADSGPVGVDLAVPEEEVVLFVSPPISVENVYVPPPGGPAAPPKTHATGAYRQPPRPRQAARRPAYPRQPSAAYAQPRPQPGQKRTYQPHPQQQYSQMPPSPAHGARVAR
jgi:hypothetical protein